MFITIKILQSSILIIVTQRKNLTQQKVAILVVEMSEVVTFENYNSINSDTSQMESESLKFFLSASSFPLITRPLEAFIWILGAQMSNLEMKGKNSPLISLDD